ncbi:MAG: hypothetical protein AAFV53_19360 [Myxococcota bacterium]
MERRLLISSVFILNHHWRRALCSLVSIVFRLVGGSDDAIHPIRRAGFGTEYQSINGRSHGDVPGRATKNAACFSW